MRAILFRGKRIDNGEWVEGGFYIEDYTDKTFILRWNSFGLGFMESIEVDRESIGQYTGLKDKNGQMIWEGDIFPHPFYSICKYIVEWENDTAGFGWFNGDGCGFSPDDIEIIGNIHDNPELLKEET